MRNVKKQLVVLISCVLVSSTAFVSAEDWPQWRGPSRDNRVSDFKAPATWPKALNKKWTVTVGKGESSPLLVGDKIYTFGRQGNDEVAMCIDAGTGKEVWKDKFAVAFKASGDNAHAGPRSTPAVAEGKFCTFGVNGDLSCLDAGTGKVLWRKKTDNANQWHTSSSPLLVDGMCIIYTTALTAYGLADGATKWQSSDKGKNVYGSPALVTVAGTKHLVTQNGKGAIVGVSLTDGKVLWNVSYTGDHQTPIVDGQTIFCSGPNGTIGLKIDKEGDKFTATQLWKDKSAAKATKYNTPVLNDGVLKGGLIFGISNGLNIFCVDAANGKQLWSAKGKEGECGHIVSAGPVLFALGSDDNLVVFEPNGKEYKELARYKGVSGKAGIDGPWSCPIITGSRIYIKDNAGSLTLSTID